MTSMTSLTASPFIPKYLPLSLPRYKSNPVAPSGPAAAAGLDFRIISAGLRPRAVSDPDGFNAPLEFLTGFTPLTTQYL
jgi:hypothetical protein